MSLDAAQELGITALTFLAEDMTRLGRFLTLTGQGPASLREHAREPQLLAAVLEYLMSDESLLLVFAATSGTPPELIAPAHQVLQLHQEAAGNA